VDDVLAQLRARVSRAVEGTADIPATPSPVLGQQVAAVDDWLRETGRDVRRRVDKLLVEVGNLPVVIHVVIMLLTVAVAYLLGRLSGLVLYGLLGG
jgi:predicted hotdog family 3-hydroxylacyl-ACP dehydratase